MRTSTLVVSIPGVILLLVSCSGDGKPADGSWGTTLEEEPVVIDCEERPPYNLPTLDCAQLGNAFERTVDALNACNEASDCVLVRPQCETWNAVGCYYAANTCVTQQVVQEFNAEATGCSENNNSCTCDAPPEVDCINHTCVIIDG